MPKSVDDLIWGEGEKNCSILILREDAQAFLDFVLDAQYILLHSCR